MTVTIAGLACELADRCRETTQTTGTGTYSLDGAATGFQTFVAGVGSGNRCPYIAVLGSNWESGVGTVTTGAPATLSRDTILASTNSDNAVSWGAGSKDIRLHVPSDLADQIWPQPSLPTRRTAIATTSGSTQDFTSISSSATRLVGDFRQVSTTGTTGFGLRLGTASAFLTTGYNGTITRITDGAVTQSIHSDRFIVTGTAVATDEYSGHFILTKISADIWVISGMVAAEDAVSNSWFAGQINMAAALTRIRLITADTFDGGLFGLAEESDA